MTDLLWALAKGFMGSAIACAIIVPVFYKLLQREQRRCGGTSVDTHA